MIIPFFRITTQMMKMLDQEKETNGKDFNFFNFSFVIFRYNNCIHLCNSKLLKYFKLKRYKIFAYKFILNFKYIIRKHILMV